MRVKTKIYKHDKRSIVEQTFTEQKEDNGYHTEKIQGGPSPTPLNTGITKKHRKVM